MTSRSPFPTGKTVCDAKQIQSCQCKCNSDQMVAPHFFPQKEMAKNRNDNNIAGSDKSCTSDSCILDAHLLKNCWQVPEEYRSRHRRESVYRSVLPVVEAIAVPLLGGFSVIQKENAWNQDDSSDDASNSVESKSAT